MMLLHLPRKYRSEDDDHAPVDYSYVPSVAEGERLRQKAPIHQETENVAVRHRAEPGTRAAESGDPASAAQPGAPRGYEAARRLPRAGDGPVTAASIAYPRPRDNAFAQTPIYTARPAQPIQAADEPIRTGYGTARSPQTFAPRVVSVGDAPVRNAEEPRRYTTQGVPPPEVDANRRGSVGVNADPQSRAYASTPETSPDRQTARQDDPPPGIMRQTCTPQEASGRRSVEAGDLFAPDGSQYAPPAPQEVPDWLRTARQNNMPFEDERRRRAPRVEPAPARPVEPAPTDLLGRPISPRNIPAPANVLPSRAEEYQAAGYPSELIEQQRYHEQLSATDISNVRRRHGAQLAAPPDPPPGQPGTRRALPAELEMGAATQPSARAQTRADCLPTREEYARRAQADREAQSGYQRATYAPRGDFAPDPRDVYSDFNPSAQGYRPNPDANRTAPRGVRNPEPQGEEPEQEEHPKRDIPWLGIAAFAAVMVVVGLWIMQMTFHSQTQAVFSARANAEAKLESNHPYGYRELIERESAANNLHPAFVAAIVLNESSFNPNAESNVGARGLMQMMPDTAEWVHGKMGLKEPYSFDLMYDPDTNVQYACWYLAFLSARFHNDPILVSAAFHAGQNTVQNWLNDSRYSADSQSISLDKMAEGPTKSYATRVLKAFAAYRRLYYEGALSSGVTSPATQSVSESKTAAVRGALAAQAPETAGTVIAVR